MEQSGRLFQAEMENLPEATHWTKHSLLSANYAKTQRYGTYTKVLKTTAPKTKIKELSKEFPSIQSYDYSVIDRNPINHNNATDRNLIKEQK